MEQVATGYGLIEGPVWDPARGLYFSDVMNGGVFPARSRRQGLARRPQAPRHRRHGAARLGRDRRGRPRHRLRLAEGRRDQSLLALDAIPGATGFNDLTTDGAGRIYVGSLAFKVFGGETPKPGHLHVIDLDGSMRTLSDGVMLTNGLGFSPDGKLLYHCDARAALVRVYDVKRRRQCRAVAQVRRRSATTRCPTA